jgi:hypothetical protein
MRPLVNAAIYICTYILCRTGIEGCFYFSPKRTALGNKLLCIGLSTGANPTLVSYANAVKIYNTTSSLGRFINKLFSSSLKNAITYHDAFVLVLKQKKIVGLAPGLIEEVCRYVCNPAW